MISVTSVQNENLRALIVHKETSTYIFRYQATIRNALKLKETLLWYAQREDLDFTWDDIEAIAIHMKIISQSG